MIEFLYKGKYTDLSPEVSADDVSALLRIHTDMYRLADIYEIAPLTEEARTRYVGQVERHFTMDWADRSFDKCYNSIVFVESIPYVYSATPKDCGDLRAAAVKLAKRYRHIIAKEEKAALYVKELVASILQFAADLAQDWLDTVVKCEPCGKAMGTHKGIWRCDDCDARVQTAAPRNLGGGDLFGTLGSNYSYYPMEFRRTSGL